MVEDMEAKIKEIMKEKRTRISYEVAKVLKEFLGDSAPDPIGNDWWYHNDPDFPNHITHGPNIYGKTGKEYGDYPAYRLEDLLSREFCEALCSKKGIEFIVKNDELFVDNVWGMQQKLNCAYYYGGLDLTERVIIEMCGKGGQNNE
jgi:hypothetical protein